MSLRMHTTPQGLEIPMTLASVIVDGRACSLGNLAPTNPHWRELYGVYGKQPSTPMVPRDKWLSLMGDTPPDHTSPFMPPVHYQNGVGQCNADATAALAEYTRAKQGLPFVQLSAADLYARINGGGDNGSILEDAMAEMLAHGIGTAATCGTIWKRGNPLAPLDERARFRAIEVFLCPTFDHVMSAGFSGFGIVSGVMWGSYGVGPDGWLNGLNRGPFGGHAVFGYKPTYRRTNGVGYGIWHQNSWGTSWGFENTGRAVFPEQLYHSGDVGGWWALRAVVDEGGVVPT